MIHLFDLPIWFQTLIILACASFLWLLIDELDGLRRRITNRGWGYIMVIVPGIMFWYGVIKLLL